MSWALFKAHPKPPPGYESNPWFALDGQRWREKRVRPALTYWRDVTRHPKRKGKGTT